MTPIVIATKGSKSINVLLESIWMYVPREVTTYVYGKWDSLDKQDWVHYLGENDKTNFGDSFNHAITQAFLDGHEMLKIK